MRVCFVNMPFEYYSPVSGGAISTIIRAVAAELRRDGHAVDVVSYVDAAHPPEAPVFGMGDFRNRSFVERATGRLRHRGLGGRYRRDVSNALGRLSPQPEMIVVFNDYQSPRWLRRIVPTATIVVWLQNDEVVPADVDWSCVDTVLTCSDYIRDRAVERGAPQARCHTAASGVDLDIFVARESWLEPSRPVRVLCMGRLDPNKGHDAAVAAVSALREAGMDVTVTLAGAKWWYGNDSDTYVESLLEAVADADGEFLGLVDRTALPAVVRAHDICMVLSRSPEPFGLVVLEAMASGLAVIASDRGGLPQACGGAAVALVDPDEPQAVLDALRSVAEPDAHAQLAAAKTRSRARAEEASWGVTARAFMAAVTSA